MKTELNGGILQVCKMQLAIFFCPFGAMKRKNETP
jgi:hypothetical protein